MKTNKELGAVYLEVEDLDKERFKELTKGMDFSSECLGCEVLDVVDFNLRYRYIENFSLYGDYFRWIGGSSYEKTSRKITLDELEELLNGTKPRPTHFAISPEDYEEYQELKKLKEKKDVEVWEDEPMTWTPLLHRLLNKVSDLENRIEILEK